MANNPATYTVKVGSLAMTPTSAAQFIKRDTMDFSDDLGQRSSGKMALIDTTGAQHFSVGTPVWVYDAAGAVVWSGALAEDIEDRVGFANNALSHAMSLTDGSYFVAKRLCAKSYQNQLAGFVVGDLLASYFNAEGVIGTRVQPNFTRSSIATRNSDGVDVTTGNPRYEPGGLAASSAIRIEEQTTNLLSANQSNVETNTTGFSAAASALLTVGATLTRDTGAGNFWQGVAALKVVTTASAGEGAETTAISATANTKYTAQARIKGTAGKVVTLALRDFTNSVVGSVDVTLTGGSTFDRATITITTGGSAVTDLRMCVKSKNAEVLTFYVDAWQIEAKKHPTSWQIGGTQRQDEKLQLPAYGAIRPDMGTIMLRTYIDGDARRQVSGSSPSLFGIDKGPVAGFGGALNIFHSDNSANWVVNISSSSFPSFADSCTPDGWHHFALTWDASSLLVYVDGTLRCTSNNPPLYPLFAPFLYIGTDGGGFNQIGTLYQDVKVDVRKWSASEVAAASALTSFAPLGDTTSYLATLNGTLAATTSIEDGPTLPSVIINYAHGDQAMTALSEAAIKYWNVDRYRLLHFRDRAAILGAAIAGDLVLEDSNVKVTRSGPLYRNREFIPGTDKTSPQTETRKGNSNDRAWTFSYPLAQVPSAFTVNAVTKILGIKGIDSGKDYYWSAGDATIAQDSGGTLLTGSDTISMTYVGTYPTVFTAEDTAEVATNLAVEGGDTTGYVDEVDNIPGANSSSASAQFAAGKLARFSQQGKIVTFTTRVTGYHSGQLCNVTVLSHGIVAEPMLIESVRAYDSGLDVYYQIKAVDGPTSSNWLDFFNAIEAKVREVTAVNVGSGAPLVVSATTSETWTWGESVSEVVTTCLFPGAAVFPGATQWPC